MKKKLVYVAHPIKPIAGETLEGNIRAAGEYLRALQDAGVFAIAPYLYPLEHWADDTDPKQRERGIACGEYIASRCDAVVWCGPRTSDGMRREGAACEHVLDGAGVTPEGVAQSVSDWILGR